MHDSIADPKYEGVKTSTKKLMEISDDEDEGGDKGEEEKESEGVDEGVGEEESDDDGEELQEEGEEWDDDVPSDSEEESGGEEETEEEEQQEERKGSLTTKRRMEEETGRPDDLKNTLQKTREEDLRKGKAVIRQLVSARRFFVRFLNVEEDQSIWDSLLDARIRLQKIVTTVNQVALVCAPFI